MKLAQCRNLLVFGGSFDPPHLAHVKLPALVQKSIGADGVAYIPTAQQPLKTACHLASTEHRLAMLKLAVSHLPDALILTDELNRPGPSYTIDTLGHFHREHGTAELYFLMGADSLRDLPTWKDPVGICQIATPVVVDRGGADSLDLSGLEGLLSPERLAAVRTHRVVMPRIDISGSDLRSRVAAAKSIRYQTPRAVEKYIETGGLYR